MSLVAIPFAVDISKVKSTFCSKDRELFEKIKHSSACAIFSKRFRLSNARKIVLLCDVLFKHQMHMI